jgi:hypothetical protein
MFSASKSASVSGAYALTKSLRFRGSANGWLYKSFASAGNRTTWTWSGWVKRGMLNSSSNSSSWLFGWTDASTSTSYLKIGTAGAIPGSGNYNLLTFEEQAGAGNAVIAAASFVDTSAWYHIVCAFDSTQATASNRIKLYVNGIQQTMDSNTVYPVQNLAGNVNRSGNYHRLGSYNGSLAAFQFDGYMADVYFIDGQQLTPSSFGATDATTGQWSPAKYTGTYGTNGFHLTFANTTSTTTLGYDTSGNSNNWTTNNISLTAGSTYDSMNDVPVAYSATAANYCVFNPLKATTAPTNGNLQASNPQLYGTRTTIAVSSGKWYWEVTVSTGTIYSLIGVLPATIALTIDSGATSSSCTAFYADGRKVLNGVYTAYGSSFTTGDVIGIALDCNGNTIQFYKNGTAQGSLSLFTSSGTEIQPYVADENNTASVFNANFGQQPFTYTPPSGYLALNTYNLSAPTIAQGNKYMDATLYTGTGATLAITNAGAFQPDFVWYKCRSFAYNHGLFDSVRGATAFLKSNSTDAETTLSGVTSFNSNGFTVGSDAGGNSNGNTFVAWQWKAGGTAVSNTSGSITSSVSANTTAGFSVVTYTGTGANATVGHGLGVAPNMIIIKNRTTAGTDWNVYHSSLGNTNVIYLDLTNASASSSTNWNNTSPTSSVFTVGTVGGANGSGANLVAYCFAQVAGFSAFGSYTGNKSTTGPFVYLGFRPKFIMFKNSSSVGGDWSILDTSRSPYNVMNSALQPNGSYAEASNSNYTMNYYSNGFQIGTINDELNSSGGTIVYMAFAENPMKYANAR